MLPNSFAWGQIETRQPRVISTRVASADWNQWRGPNRDGKIAGFQAPNPWPKQLTRQWQVEVGTGLSSPLQVGEAVFIFARQGENEVLRCLDLATGREIWRNSYPAPYQPHPNAKHLGSGPQSTPVYSEGLLHTLGISGILSCLDAQTGQVQYRHEFARQYKKSSPSYGAAVSPLVEGGVLIAHVGGDYEGALAAFDAKSGAVRWRWAGAGPAYTSPILVNLGGGRQVVTQTQTMCVGIEVGTGRLLWSIPYRTPHGINTITPVAVGDMVIFGGYQQPTFAVRLRKNDANWTPETAWETRELTMYTTSPVVSGNRLYGLSQRGLGQLCTLDIATGKIDWTGEARFAEHAAILDGGSVLLVLTMNASLRVFKKDGAALKEIVRYQVADSPTWATPAVVGQQILIKDATTLALWKY